MQLLNLPKEAFILIVAFAGTATLKIKSKQPVIYFADIKKVVLQYQNKRFSEEEIVKLAEAISSGKRDGSLPERQIRKMETVVRMWQRQAITIMTN